MISSYLVFVINNIYQHNYTSLHCLFFFDLRILITPLVSSRHYVVCSSLKYDSDCPFVSSKHCDVCSSLIYGFWLPIWYLQDIILSVPHWCTILITRLYLQDIVLSVLLWYTDSDYPFGIFKTLYCLFFLDVRILITPLVSSRHYVVCSSLKYGFWLPICIFKTFCCLVFFDIRILVTPLVSSRHYIFCSSLIYGFWLPLWYLQDIVLSVFFNIRIMITHLYLQDILLSVLLWCTDSSYPFGIFKTLCYLFFFDIRIMITPFGIFKTLRCLFFFDIRILITPLVSSRNCVVCSSIYGFWLHLWYLQTTLININTDMNNTGLSNRGEVADW